LLGTLCNIGYGAQSAQSGRHLLDISGVYPRPGDVVEFSAQPNGVLSNPGVAVDR